MTKTIFTEFTPEDREEIKGKGARKVKTIGNKYRLYECPLTFTTETTTDLIDLVVLTNESGVLPFKGAWTDQPFWFVEAFMLYKKEMVDAQKQTLTETKAKEDVSKNT